MRPHDLAVTPQGANEVLISRSFHAPRTLVWRAMTDPALLPKWMKGPPGWEMHLCQNDLRVGGAYRWGWKDNADQTIFIFGVNKTVNAPEENARTETMEGTCAPPNACEVLATMRLKERSPGTTHMTITVLCPNTDVRDAVLNSGMEHGLIPSYETLDTMLAAGL